MDAAGRVGQAVKSGVLSRIVCPRAARRRRGTRRGITEPGCGRCGYPVHGLESNICPECGADRAVVGVVEPRGPTPRWVVTLGWVGAWMVTVSLLASLLNPLLLPGTPRNMSDHRDYKLRPRSGAYPTLDVRRIGYAFGSPWLGTPKPSPDRGWIKFVHRPNEKYLSQVDVYALGRMFTYGMSKWAGRQFEEVAAHSGKLDEAVLLRWLSQMEIDTTRPDVRAEMSELLALFRTADIDALRDAPPAHFEVLETSGDPQWEAARQNQWMLHAMWAVVAAMGALAIVRRRRQSRRAPA